MRFAVVLLLLAAPDAGGPVPLRDFKPGFVKGGVVLRSRTARQPGLFVGGQRYRGLCAPVPSRIGLDLDGAFARVRIKVGVLDGGAEPVRFRIVGGGRALASTPPLFPGAPPVQLEVPIENVLLLELVAEGEGASQAAWLDGLFYPAAGKDLGRFRAIAAPFNPRDYPTEFRRRVNDAIRRGVLFLKGRQLPGGDWPSSRREGAGVTALMTLALLKSGVPADDPGIGRAFAFLRQQPYENTYSVSCLLMALEAKYFPGGADDKSAYLDRPRLARKLISDEDLEWIRAASGWLADQQGAGFPAGQEKLHPVWRYPQGGYDLSCTQYALFGLSAAHRCGVPHSRAWLPALKYLLGVQEKEGPRVEVSRYVEKGESLRRHYEYAKARGFSYQPRRGPTGAMTTAGLCSLILCQQAVYKKASFQQGYKIRTREAMRDALAWLEEYYDVERNPFQGRAWWYYYLFNLERAGVLLDQRYIGTRDWYEEGAEALMARQAAAGGFENSLLNTAFALLFLKRATVPAVTSPLK